MIILCDHDTKPPKVPTIDTYEKFRDFIETDIARLQLHGVSNAGYFHEDTGYVANVIMVPCGAVIEYSQI